MYDDKISLCQGIMSKLGLDYILIFNSFKEEPSFASWLLAEEPFDVMYIVIKKNEKPMLFVAGRFEELARQKYPFFNVIPAYQKINMIQYVIPLLNIGKIGVAGNIPYKEYFTLQEAGFSDIQNIESELQTLYAIKNDSEKNKLSVLRNYTTNLLESLVIKAGMTEKQVEEEILKKIENDGYTLNFLCITGNELLHTTTIAEASETIINDGNTLCIDFGIVSGGYHSDATRCYFIGENYSLESAYKRIQEVIFASLKYIYPGQSSKTFIKEFEKISEEYDLPGYILTDLGHGIGTSLHEYPDLFHDDFIFEKGMVFTLEPEYRVGEYLLRYEDVFYIDNEGICRLLS